MQRLSAEAAGLGAAFYRLAPSDLANKENTKAVGVTPAGSSRASPS